MRTHGVQAIVVVLLTRAVAFAPTDNLASRKLIERGVRKPAKSARDFRTHSD